MRQAEVEKYLYDKILDKFSEWMKGQTVGVYKNGSTNYYKWDVERFVSSHLEREPTYFD